MNPVWTTLKPTSCVRKRGKCVNITNMEKPKPNELSRKKIFLYSNTALSI